MAIMRALLPQVTRSSDLLKELANLREQLLDGNFVDAEVVFPFFVLIILLSDTIFGGAKKWAALRTFFKDLPPGIPKQAVLVDFLIWDPRAKVWGLSSQADSKSEDVLQPTRTVAPLTEMLTKIVASPPPVDKMNKKPKPTTLQSRAKQALDKKIPFVEMELFNYLSGVGNAGVHYGGFSGEMLNVPAGSDFSQSDLRVPLIALDAWPPRVFNKAGEDLEPPAKKGKFE